MQLPRIALCSFSHGVSNGIARMDELLARGLAGEGFDVSRYAILPHIPDGAAETDIQFIRIEDAFAVLSEAFQNIDLVQFNGGFDPCVTFAAARAGVPLVVETMHTVEQGGIHPETDAIICVSERVLQEQRHPNCLVIHNGIDCDRFPFKPGLHAERPTLVQVANRGKALLFSLEELLPDLRRSHPSCDVMLAGGRTVQPDSGVRDCGVVRDMPTLYHKADLNILACAVDSFGLVLAEGMACGCLPIGSVASGAREFIENGRTGWLVDGDMAAWRKAVLRALDILGSRDHLHMQEQARSSIEQQYSIKTCVRRYAECYRSLWKGIPKERRIRYAAHAWMPLLQATMLAGHDLPRALACLNSFISQAVPLETPLLKHPSARYSLRVAAALCELLLRDGRVPEVRAFCALMRAQGIRGSNFMALENTLRHVRR